ncbi:MAG TPA: hemolysin family protein [Roseiarcus sp.]|jgi:CBS domain containing-hemolysin-like protein
MSESQNIARPGAERAASPGGREAHPGLIERLRGLFGLGQASVRDDIEDALDDAGTNADFTPQERAILKNVLGLHDVRVADVMVPRADIIAVSIEATLGELLALFRTAGHSRLPVYGETLDDPRGMVHIRDFVDFLASEAHFGLAEPSPAANPSPEQKTLAAQGMKTPLSAARILRPVLFAPPSMPALDLLVKMQASRTHMALVIDEYGGTDGLVSMEDVVEAIVGDIEDEHDEADRPGVVAAGDGSYVVEARTSLEDVSEAVGFDFSKLADAEDVDTIGGLLTAAAGRVPGRGEIVTGAGDFEFEVLDADPRRVKRLKIVRRAVPRRRPAAVQGARAEKEEAEPTDKLPPAREAP